MKIVLNKKTRKKFDNLLMEVAEYYNIRNLISYHEKGISYISLVGNALNLNENTTFDGVILSIKGQYPYLLPFYLVWKNVMYGDSVSKYDELINKNIFNEINEVIKQIRIIRKERFLNYQL